MVVAGGRTTAPMGGRSLVPNRGVQSHRYSVKLAPHLSSEMTANVGAAGPSFRGSPARVRAPVAQRRLILFIGPALRGYSRGEQAGSLRISRDQGDAWLLVWQVVRACKPASFQLKRIDVAQ